MSTGDSLEILSQAVLVGIILVWRLGVRRAPCVHGCVRRRARVHAARPGARTGVKMCAWACEAHSKV